MNFMDPIRPAPYLNSWNAHSAEESFPADGQVSGGCEDDNMDDFDEDA